VTAHANSDARDAAGGGARTDPPGAYARNQTLQSAAPTADNPLELDELAPGDPAGAFWGSAVRTRVFNLYVCRDGSVGGTLSSFPNDAPVDLVAQLAFRSLARVHYASVADARTRVGPCGPDRVVTVNARRIESADDWGRHERRSHPRESSSAPFAFDDLPPGGVS
jgi:hypothetical protein